MPALLPVGADSSRAVECGALHRFGSGAEMVARDLEGSDGTRRARSKAPHSGALQIWTPNSLWSFRLRLSQLPLGAGKALVLNAFRVLNLTPMSAPLARPPENARAGR